jgi:hypothetical protein
LKLVCDALKNGVDSQLLGAPVDCGVGAARDNTHDQALAAHKLNTLAVLNMKTLEALALLTIKEASVCHDPIHVQKYCLNGLKAFGGIGRAFLKGHEGRRGLDNL